MQGYLFAKPLAAGPFHQLISAGTRLPRPPEVPTASTKTILLVDDEPNVLAALSRLLALEGYRVLTAGNAFQGLEMLALHPVQVILSDQGMPQMTGTEFLGRVKELHPETVRLVLSGYYDQESVTRAVNEGSIYKFLYKPWDNEQLRRHVQDAFIYHEAVIRPGTRRTGA